MGRPREHDQSTARKLLAEAERTVQAHGLAALSVRAIAAEAGTSTRAVYSLFGSRDGLIVALGVHAYELLGGVVAALPVTDDPAADLVEAGLVFRRFAREHPALFTIGIQRVLPSADLWNQLRAAAGAALEILCVRLDRLGEREGLGGRSTLEAAWQFHALCEGLAAAESRSLRDGHDLEAHWQGAVAALVHGFAAAQVMGEAASSDNHPAQTNTAEPIPRPFEIADGV